MPTAKAAPVVFISDDFALESKADCVCLLEEKSIFNTFGEVERDTY